MRRVKSQPAHGLWWSKTVQCVQLYRVCTVYSVQRLTVERETAEGTLGSETGGQRQ